MSEGRSRGTGEPGSRTDAPSQRSTVSVSPAESLGVSGGQIGPYKLLSVLGEGGFGVVYLAERREPHVQRVALKLIKPGMDSRAVIARFEAERQAMAVMDHPNVAKVLDAGTTSVGHPYFVMEYLQGEPFTEYCDRHTLAIEQRLELFMSVCAAVQHAHTKGVIHRDIKPSNILVTVGDTRPIAKVIDFGVAKAISQSFTDKTIFTQAGHIIGTPEYMSPEQAEMGALDIDTRADVYSLGVVLYELLAGLLPFDTTTLRSQGYAGFQRLIRELDPPKPSTRLEVLRRQGQDASAAAAAIASRRRSRLDDLIRVLRRELDWIPLKAMRKDRTERYATVNELGEDLANYLAGRPLRAGPESSSYRFRKFLRRNRTKVGIGAALAAALLVAMGSVVVGAYLAIRTSLEWQVEADKGKIGLHLLTTLLTEPYFGDESAEMVMSSRLDTAMRRHEHELSRSPTAESSIRTIAGLGYLQQGNSARAIEQLTRAVEVSTAVYGFGNSMTLLSMKGLASALLAGVEADPAIITLEDQIMQNETAVDVIQSLIAAYDIAHARDPGEGYDRKAAEWRLTLRQLEK